MKKIFISIALSIILLDKADGYGLITDRVKDNVSGNITRQEFAEIVVRLYELITGKKAETGNISFTDTINEEILKAANMGMVMGVAAANLPRIILSPVNRWLPFY